MADLSITASNVLAGTGSTKAYGTAGATITAGQVVYLDSSSGKYKLCDVNSATAAVRDGVGLSLNGASDGQPLAIVTGGPVTIGATLTAGATYYASGTPGGIRPAADNTTGDYPVILGIATSTTVLNVKIQEAGVAL